MVRTTSQGLVVYESGDPATVIQAGMPTGDSTDAAIARVSDTGPGGVIAEAIADAIVALKLLTYSNTDGGDPAFSIVDINGRRSWVEISNTGGMTPHAIAAVLADLGPGLSVTIDTVLAGKSLPLVYNDVSGLSFVITDSVGRRSDIELGQDGHFTQRVVDAIGARLPAGTTSAEVVAARGTQPSLTSRLDRTSSSDGYPLRYRAFEHNLRWTRMLTRRLLYGDAGSQFNIALIGDSYTFPPTRWSRPFWTAMKNTYGDGGVGWVGFSNDLGSQGINGSVRPDVTVVETGAWTDTYTGTKSPDLGEETSTTAGNTIVVTFPAGHTTGKLFSVGGSGGAITYAFNGGGATTPLTLPAGTALSISTLAGISATSTTLTITVVSGEVRLCGVHITGTTNGVVVSKLGSTGSRASHWAAVNAASWQSGIAAINPDLIVIMLGTNDQGNTPAVFTANMQTILTNVQTAVGGATAADILVVMPAENQRGLAVTMASYAAAMLPVAEANRAAYLNTQLLFGDDPADYAYGSARPWYSSDNVHPDPTTGGRVLADAIYRTINYS